MQTSLLITPDCIDLSPGAEVILRHQTWDDYESLLQIRGDNAAIKLRYNGATQEIRIMAPLPGHGRRIDALADFVKALLKREGRDWDSAHPITLKRLQRIGVEPDACFYIQNFQAILGQERIDLETSPPPDLAIEMDLTSSTNVQDYGSLKVPEVWIYRVGNLDIYLWTGEEYQASDTSLVFPGINIKQVLPHYVERAWEIGSSVALREFEQTGLNRED